MTLPIERARSRKPVTWLTLIGVLLLPVVIGGILVASLYNPAERLDSIDAAIVNNDEPVTINDQTVPLGRQLTAGLVKGSDEIDSNLTWTISNADDAAAGLADGTYDAVVTIPEGFSAAATSTQPGKTPEQATIGVKTPPDSLVVDDAITAQVTQAAAGLMGQQLSKVYLENVFLGFTTLGDKLGEAASGAQQLADGAQQTADGAAQLPGGVTQLADGAGQLSTGATSLTGGLNQISAGIGGAAGGATDLANGLDQAAAGVQNQQLKDAANASATYSKTTADQTAALAQSVGGVALSAKTLAETVGALDAQCAASGADEAYCAQVTAALASAGGVATAAGGAAQAAVTAATSAGYASGYAAPTATGIASLMDQTSTGVQTAADGARGLAAGLSKLQSATSQSASGASQLASGASQLADGGTQLAEGSQSLADGVSQLATGTDSLASGLDSAVAQIPSYTEDQATSLAEVVADPVAAKGNSSSLFGASAIPLLATAALWFGALATFVAMQAVTRRSLASRSPSALLALRAFLPPAGIGALQGLLVAGVVQLAASYDWGAWSVFAALCVAAGVAFAAVNQALVAVFGGAGRWISALIGAFAVATGIVSTVPPVIASIASLLPTAPAYNAMVSALTSTAGVGAGLVGLLVWALLSFVATVIAVARRRTVSARSLIEASVATA